MKQSKTIRSKGVLAVLAFALASAISGSAMVINVPADYSTIQAAVNAANNGDTIQIGAGIYTNQVVVANKNLTLSGSPGAVLRATPGMQRSLVPAAGTNAHGVCLLGVFESDVVVSGLTFEGERLADSQPGGYIGIWFLAAGGGVEDCRLTGFRGKAIDSTNDGYAVKVGNPNYGFGQVDVQVLRNTFADNAVSISLAGDQPPPNGSWHPELLKTTFTVNDNIIAGNGPDDTGAQFGVWISAGAGGEVKQNTITDYSYTGTNSVYNHSPNAIGLLAHDSADFGGNLQPLQLLTFEGNIFRNNQIDMVLMRADFSTITNNSFEGTAPGLGLGGLGFSGDHVQVANNRFSDMEAKPGIVLFGGGPVYGTRLGIATNATLTANGFCQVATNYVFGPLATYDLQSTLPPCTGPELDISRSVLLSWPYSDDGYSLETATNMNGPWTTSDATVFQEDGRNNAAVPADRPEQIYRLAKP